MWLAIGLIACLICGLVVGLRLDKWMQDHSNPGETYDQTDVMKTYNQEPRDRD